MNEKVKTVPRATTKRDQLLADLEEAARYKDIGMAQDRRNALILEYIGDAEITAAFHLVPCWRG